MYRSYVCMTVWLRSPPLMREGPGSTPDVGEVVSVLNSFGLPKRRSGWYITVGDCCRRLRSNRAPVFTSEIIYACLGIALWGCVNVTIKHLTEPRLYTRPVTILMTLQKNYGYLSRVPCTHAPAWHARLTTSISPYSSDTCSSYFVWKVFSTVVTLPIKIRQSHLVPWWRNVRRRQSTMRCRDD